MPDTEHTAPIAPPEPGSVCARVESLMPQGPPEQDSPPQEPASAALGESTEPERSVRRQPRPPVRAPQLRQRMRLRFSKQGDIRFISHRDLVRALERLARRCRLPLGMTEGFHPRPRMSFPAPLAVGINGRDEVMELELCQPLSGEELAARLAASPVPGLEFTRVELIAPGRPKARAVAALFEIDVPPQRRVATDEAIGRLLAARSWIMGREKGKQVDIRPFVSRFWWRDDATAQEGSAPAGAAQDSSARLCFELGMCGEGTARPREALSAIGLSDLEEQGMVLERARVILADDAESGATSRS